MKLLFVYLLTSQFLPPPAPSERSEKRFCKHCEVSSSDLGYYVSYHHNHAVSQNPPKYQEPKAMIIDGCGLRGQVSGRRKFGGELLFLRAA